MKIFLIRHGESDSDIKQKYDGDYDDHLTETGLHEAEQVAQKLGNKSIEIIFSSRKIRAQQTSQVLSRLLRCPIEIEEGLNEQDIYRAFPKLGKDQPEEEYRKLGELLANRDEAIEGVESYRQFKDRIIHCFNQILDSGYHTIAIVTHGGPIRCIFREILKLGELKRIGNGAIFELKKEEFDLTVISMDSLD